MQAKVSFCYLLILLASSAIPNLEAAVRMAKFLNEFSVQEFAQFLVRTDFGQVFRRLRPKIVRKYPNFGDDAAYTFYHRRHATNAIETWVESVDVIENWTALFRSVHRMPNVIAMTATDLYDESRDSCLPAKRKDLDKLLKEEADHEQLAEKFPIIYKEYMKLVLKSIFENYTAVTQSEARGRKPSLLRRPSQ